MPRPVCITYDSTCDLTPQLLERFQIRTVPLTIQSGERVFADDGQYTSAELYADYRQMCIRDRPDTADTETVWETVSEAYIYAFPLVLTDATKTLSTNTDGTMPGRAPINQFNHAKKLADASFRTVVTPNVDTVYSQAWLDLSLIHISYLLETSMVNTVSPVAKSRMMYCHMPLSRSCT